MTELTKLEAKKIKAGGLTGNLISALNKTFEIILDIGRAFGSAIRRLTANKSCALK